MANLDDEDPTRGARVELALHYARKGDAAEALGIVAGLSRDLRDALLPIVKALLISSEVGFGGTARCGHCGRPVSQSPLNQGPLKEHAAPPPDPLYFAQETARRSPDQRVVLPFPDVRPHLETRSQPQPQAQARVSAEKSRRADLSLALGLVAMSAYLLWRLTGPLRATRIGSVSLLLGTETSIALMTGSVWLVLMATRSWGVNQYWSPPREPSPQSSDVREPESDQTW
jgi:hypothetical protein